MSLAELFLRLGLALVAWLTVLAHCVWIAALRAVDCSVAGIEPWFLTLVSAPVVVILALTLPQGNKVAGVASLLRLPAIGLAPLMVLALWSVGDTLVAVTFGDAGICEVASSTWQRWWAPLQFTVLAIIGASAWRAWRV